MNLEAGQTKLTLGFKIRKRRLELGLSQQEVVAGRYSTAYLSRVERDQMQPSADFLAYLAEQLALSVIELVSETVKVNPKTKKLSPEAQELELTNASIALQTRQYQNAKTFLAKLDLSELEPGLLGRYYAILGETRVELKEYSAAEADLKYALELLEGKPAVPALQVEEVRKWLGLAYYRQDKHLLAIEQHEQCLRAINAGRIDSKRFKMKIYYNLGNEYHFLGSTNLAVQFYREAMKLAEGGEDNTDLAGIYWGIGLAYRSAGNFAIAKLYLQKSSELYDQLGDSRLAVTLQNILGQTLVDRQEYTQAQSVLVAALAGAYQLQDDLAISHGHNNLAYLFYSQHQLSEAATHAQQGVNYARKVVDRKVLGQALAQQGEIVLALQDTEQGCQLFDEALSILEQTDSLEHLGRIYFRYATALEKINQLAEAIRQYRKAYECRRQGEITKGANPTLH